MLGFGPIASFPISSLYIFDGDDGGGIDPSDEFKSIYATGELVHNIVPIIFAGGYSFTTDSRYQAVETKSYTTNPDVGIAPFGTHGVQRYTLIGGEMPPGLVLQMPTGIITGTVGTIFSDENLEKLIVAYPDDSINIDGGRDGGGTFWLKRPSEWDTYYTVTRTYNFTVQGWDIHPTTGQPIPGATADFSISVLKTWKKDVDNYNALPLETRIEIGKKEPQS